MNVNKVYNEVKSWVETYHNKMRRNEMNNLIQWPTAKYWTAQWNPVIGCKPCSPACANCYAEASASPT